MSTVPATIADLTSYRDREWFESHPGIAAYLRPYVPGEFLPLPRITADGVVVTRLDEDIRTREPVDYPPHMQPWQAAELLGVAVWCACCDVGVKQ